MQDEYADAYLHGYKQALIEVQALINADAAVRDPGEFTDGTGRRDPVERGYTLGLESAMRFLEDQQPQAQQIRRPREAS